MHACLVGLRWQCAHLYCISTQCAQSARRRDICMRVFVCRRCGQETPHKTICIFCASSFSEYELVIYVYASGVICGVKWHLEFNIWNAFGYKLPAHHTPYYTMFSQANARTLHRTFERRPFCAMRAQQVNYSLEAFSIRICTSHE